MEKMEKILKRIEAGRQYRNTAEIFRAAKAADSGNEMIVEGHASTFNQPYTLYEDGEVRIDEQVDRNAFEECDMSDVIFQFDHEGRVLARNRNKTLEVKTDDNGLFVRADLSKSELGPGLYRDISAGLVDRMSFGFRIDEDVREITEDKTTGKITMMRTITKVGKLYDVSAVSIPANDSTDISARAFCDGWITELKAERLEKRAKAERLRAECLAYLSL